MCSWHYISVGHLSLDSDGEKYLAFIDIMKVERIEFAEG